MRGGSYFTTLSCLITDAVPQLRAGDKSFGSLEPESISPAVRESIIAFDHSKGKLTHTNPNSGFK